MDAAGAILDELHGLRRRLPGVAGTVLASVDGLAVASDLPGIDPDPIAALSAANLGLARQFAQAVGHGPALESVVRAADGFIVTYPAGISSLLAVLAQPDTDLARLHQESLPVAYRLGSLYESGGGWDGLPTPSTTPERRTPRSARASAPTSPVGLPARRAVLRPPGRP
jgi:predicted regulator of Ras-like GTPase activity (Roadblock/LC7/MglB family)